jgi:hypothetical protein
VAALVAAIEPDPALFDPAMGRFLAKLRSLATISRQPRA